MGKRMNARLPSCQLALVVILSTVSTQSAWAGRFAWVPVSATGSHSISGNDITLIGTNQRVTLELRVSNWDPDLNGNPTLAAYQGAIDSTGYNNGTGISLSPVTTPDESAGAFIVISRCTVGQQLSPNGAPCGSGFPSCPSGEFCVGNPVYIFDGFNPLAVLSTVQADYFFGGVAQSGSKPDNGAAWYGGTLVLNVPTGAKGDYVIDFINDVNFTFLNDSVGLLIPLIGTTPATIKVRCLSATQCEDNNTCTIDRCNSMLCSNNPRAAGFDCADALFCNGTETCNGAGACLSPGAACSNLPNATCDEALGCLGPGNFNGDDTINLEDWMDFSGCLNGPDLLTPGNCVPARFDAGSDVDLEDSAAFLNVYTGN